MIPFVPPPFAFWTSHLYHALCFGLYRAIAGTWLDAARRAGLSPGRARVSCGEASGWRLLEGSAGLSSIRATSLAELSRVVRDGRSAGAAQSASAALPS
jgi:hypothetical protein